jgi:type I restriction enzyme S subunit
MSLDFLCVRSADLRQGEKRLDAGYYAQALRAHRELKGGRWRFQSLGEMADVFHPGRFKRPYAPRGKGVPFVGSREMFFWPLKPKDFLFGTPEDWRALMVEQGWILVSRSGTVGQVLLVSDDFANIAVTEHAIRLKAPMSGYLYAFLRSKYGRNLFQGIQFGAVIKQLEPHQIASFPVPLLDNEAQRSIHDKMFQALYLREEGSRLQKRVEEQLYELLGLPNPEALEPQYLPNPPGTKVPTFVVRRNELKGRLDGSYHAPEVKSLLRALRAGRYPLTPLEKLTNYIRIPPRFKRHYVDPAQGVPFLRPSDLATVRVLEQRYIAKWIPELPQLMLNRGEVLVSTDGSVGDVGYVTDAYKGWAASNNIGRIAAKDGKAHPGYLYAFLASPYGQMQLQQEVYGGVIDHLEVEHLAKIDVPDAPLDEQEKIGAEVLRAFTLRDMANKLEEETIAELEEAIAKGPVSGLA